MILNPVIAGSAEEKVYKITDNAGYILDGEIRRAGKIVTSRERVNALDSTSIKAADGTKIPYSTNEPNQVSLLFVMPAQDVTITSDGGIIP